MSRRATLLTSAAPSGYEALVALDPEVLEAIPAAVYICAADGVIVRFNRRAAELWGRAPKIGDTDERFCGSFRLHDLKGRSLPHARTPMATALRTGQPQRDKEVVIERPDGSRIVASVQIDTLKDHYGRVQGAINCFQDITERKRTEDRLARRMEEQAALYRITDSLHRARSLADVYDSALDAILRALPCQRASILLFDESGVMRFVAWRGLSDAYRRAVDGHSPWTPDAEDPKPICIDDVESADLAEPLRATIKAEGIGALAFVPLVTGGKLVGKFMSYYDTSHVFTAAELDLAVAIGRQLGFGVERIRAQQARRMAVQELRESEARERARATELQTIMEAVPAVIWIARDRDCRTISGNTAAYEVLRLSRDSNPSLSAPEDERPTHFEVLLDGRVLDAGRIARPARRARRRGTQLRRGDPFRRRHVPLSVGQRDAAARRGGQFVRGGCRIRRHYRSQESGRAARPAGGGTQPPREEHAGHRHLDSAAIILQKSQRGGSAPLFRCSDSRARADPQPPCGSELVRRLLRKRCSSMSWLRTSAKTAAT